MRPERWRAIAILMLAAFGLTLAWFNRPGTRLWTSADMPGILREVRQLRELVTVRYAIQKVTGLTEEKQPVGSESILLIFQARVLGGVDLGRLGSRDIRMDGERRVHIQLPAAQILHIEVDEKNTRVWDRTKTWWAPWVPYDKDLESKARRTALDAVRQEAIDMGILLDAQVNAQTLIRDLLRPLGIEQVTFGRTQS